MSATTAGDPGRITGAPQRPAGAAVPGRRVSTTALGPRGGAGRRVAPAVPGRRVVAAVPRQRPGAPLPGRHVAALPGQRDLRDAMAERRGRPRTARPRPTTLTVVPPRRTITAEPPGGVAAGRGSGAERRARRVAPGAARRPAGGRTRPRSRLTRRGRIVVSTLALAAMLAVAALAWVAGAARADAAGSGAPLAAVHRHLSSVVVRPGESLWTIAAQAEPTADPRGVIQEIIDLNALGGTSIQPGQRLWVPRG